MASHQFGFVVGFRLRPHHDDLQIVIIVNTGDNIGICQHALIAQKAQREIFGIVTDGHCRDDFPGIEVDRERSLLDDAQVNCRPSLIRARDGSGQPRRRRIGGNQKVAGVAEFGQLSFPCTGSIPA